MHDCNNLNLVIVLSKNQRIRESNHATFATAANRLTVDPWTARGNTDGDIVVWLPDDSMLITGDLLVAPVPYAFDSPMTDWITTLDAVAQLEAEVLIPGHGAVQRDRQYLRQVRALIEFTVEAVREAGESGVAYADLANAVDFSSFEAVFNGNDLEQAQAWFNYFVSPGVASAWSSLGYPVPAETPAE